MGAPDDTHPDWRQVRHTLSQILAEVESFTSRAEKAEWLVPLLTQMADPVPDNELKSLSSVPTRGYITDYPVFAALATQPIAQQTELARKFQALYLFAVALREYYVAQGEDRSPLRSAGRACRRIVRGSYSDERISDIVRRASSPQSMCNQLEMLLDSSRALAKKDRRLVIALLPLLRDVRGDRDSRTRQAGERKQSKPRTTANIDRSDEHAANRSYALVDEQPDEESRAELKTEGLYPEFETTRETLYAEHPRSRNPDFPAAYLTEHQAYQRLDLRARALKTSRQQVPNRREVLFEPALEPLLAPEGPVASPRERDGNWALDTLLGFMLLTGCQAEELQEVRVWSTYSRVPDQLPSLGVIQESGEFILPVARLPDSWRPESERRHHFRRPANRLRLKVPAHLRIGKRILELASWVSDEGALCGNALGSPDQLCKRLQSRVSDLNDIHHTHLTLNRISLYLSSAVYALDGDLAETLLLSYRHRNANDPRLYYHSAHSLCLQRQYARVWGAEPERSESDAERRSGLIVPANPDIGSAAVPLVDSILASVQSMTDLVMRTMAGRGRRTASRWLEIHNVLTAYVIRQIQWVTGIRAVRDPIELSLYDPRSGFLGVIDKDSNDEYGARAVWLIETVQQQVATYLRYVDSATRSIFGEVDREAAFRFIGEESKILQVNQRRLEHFLPDYPFAPNSHRHYLRTRLREKGVDGGIVDALLGHGGIGAEPYSRHSAMCPMVMRDAARGALNSIWQELGWEVMPGEPR